MSTSESQVPARQRSGFVAGLGAGVVVSVAMLGASLALGVGLGAGRHAGEPPSPPPPYSPRELADTELSTIEHEAMLTYWTTQEEKLLAVLQTMPAREAANASEQVFIAQATSLLARAQVGKQDTGMQRERMTKRLEGMRVLNGLIPPPGQAK